MSRALDTDWVRAQFPALASPWILADNAGGSAVLRTVADEVREHMLRCPVQLGASYPLSLEAGARVSAGKRAAEELINAESGEVVLGASSTVLARLLANALAPLLARDDEIVVTNLDHEANIGPWRGLQAQGVRIREWRFDPDTLALRAEDLEPLLNQRTRLVCFTHCSNVVGALHDVRAISDLAHSHGAWVCVDGVACAPHQRVDVRALGVDFYLLSLYKTFGPHLGLLYGRRDLLLRAASQNHAFISPDALPDKFEPGNINYELVSALPALLDYLQALDRRHEADHEAGAEPPTGSPAEASRQAALTRAFGHIAAHEERLSERLVEFLHRHPRTHLLGPHGSSPEELAGRAPTIAFVVEGQLSSALPARLEEQRIAARWGHFYAQRAIRDMGLAARDGVVRISLAHYNTLGEVDRICAALDEIL